MTKLNTVFWIFLMLSAQVSLAAVGDTQKVALNCTVDASSTGVTGTVSGNFVKTVNNQVTSATFYEIDSGSLSIDLSFAGGVALKQSPVTLDTLAGTSMVSDLGETLQITLPDGLTLNDGSALTRGDLNITVSSAIFGPVTTATHFEFATAAQSLSADLDCTLTTK